MQQAPARRSHYWRLLTGRPPVSGGSPVPAPRDPSLYEVSRAAIERAEEKMLEDAHSTRDNVVALASRHR